MNNSISMKEVLFKRNYFKIFLHIVWWTIFILYPFFLGIPVQENILLKILFNTSLLILFFYLNSDFLIPKILTKGRIVLYLSSVFFMISIIVSADVFSSKYLNVHEVTKIKSTRPDKTSRQQYPRPADNPIRKSTRPFFSAIFILALSTSYRLLYDYFTSERKRNELENQTLVSELSFLKSQVSPHFLFNTLNNIYSLSLTNTPRASEAILKLSHLLRYMLYETNEISVSLDKEIDYINDYIELQKMRFSNEVTIEYNTSGNFEMKEIAPMLLIPFIENAFKHGISYSKKSVIKILIELKDQELFLKVENSFDKNKEKDSSSGIGLVNIQRRLDLLYPMRYNLKLNDQNDLFIVDLKINLRS
ncbi:MAG: histidine kinase [Sporocytophaga sp.]|nr:histidine kinase [Sporocytophaga sp.]